MVGVVVDNPNEIDHEHLTQQGYRTVFLDKIDHAVLADFPCCTEFSILLSIWLVYPKLKKFIKVKHFTKIYNFPLLFE
jgi:hypothetical protein